MGTFSRLRYVVAANVNALLEKAEDPIKMLRALIREMEEAREEARIATSELLADKKHAETAQKIAGQDVSEWHHRAELAVRDDRDDLAREALQQKAAAAERADAAGKEAGEAAARLKEIEQDFVTLNQKLEQAKTLLRELSAKNGSNGHARPNGAVKASRTDRKLDRAFGRFGQLDSRLSLPTIWTKAHIFQTHSRLMLPRHNWKHRLKAWKPGSRPLIFFPNRSTSGRSWVRPHPGL